MINDNDRIFQTLQEQNRTMHEQGLQLATLIQETKSTNERLFGTGNTPGLFNVVMDHNKELGRINKQLGYAKGAAGILTLLWSGAIAIIASLIKGGHH